MNKKIEKTKLIEIDEFEFQVLISYTEIWDFSYFNEDFHGNHLFLDSELVDIELNSIEFIVFGKPIDVLNKLNDFQKRQILLTLLK